MGHEVTISVGDEAHCEGGCLNDDVTAERRYTVRVGRLEVRCTNAAMIFLHFLDLKSHAVLYIDSYGEN